MRRLLLLACCVLMAAPLLAAPTWTHASSEHFDIYTTGGNRRAREALAYFERVQAYFFAQPNLSPRLTRPIRRHLPSSNSLDRQPDQPAGAFFPVIAISAPPTQPRSQQPL